jgi:hypothetical protein
MAEKRGIDRCVLKLINAYQYDISSEVEADDFSDGKGNQQSGDNSHGEPVYEIKKPEYSITDEQKDTYQNLLSSSYYKKKTEMNEWWAKLITFEQAEAGLKAMSEQVEKYETKQAEIKAKKQAKEVA